MTPTRKVASKTGKPIPKEKLNEIVKRLQGGESALIKESKKLGFRNNDRLRAALRDHLGSKVAYAKLIAASLKQRATRTDDDRQSS